MEEHSFSLQFNPLQRIRTVKDYEREIEELKNENFELKHKMSHYRAAGSAGGIQEDIHKLLLDSKRSIDILEGENEGLNKEVGRVKEEIRRMEEERRATETKLGGVLQGYMDKVSMLEDENNRLLQHLEGVNESNGKLRNENCRLGEQLNESKNIVEEQRRYIEEIGREKEEIARNGQTQMEKEMMSYKNAISNYSKEKEQMMYEVERERAEYSSRIGQLQTIIGNLEGRVGAKDMEIARIKEYYEGRQREYEAACREKQSNEMYLREMGENYTRETREKQELALKNEELRLEVEQLRKTRGELQRRMEVVDNEKRALSYKVSQERMGAEEMSRMRTELERLRKERGELVVCIETKGEECKRRLKGVEDLAGEVDMKIDAVKNMLEFGQKPSEVRARYEQHIDAQRREIRELRSRIDAYDRMTKIEDDGREFLRTLDVDMSMPFNEIVKKFRSLYRGRRDGDGRFLQDFVSEFQTACQDLESCKEYLEKKGRENKELKASKMRLERKFDESRRNEEKMRSLCSMMSSKLKKKDDVISKLEMRIGNKS